MMSDIQQLIQLLIMIMGNAYMLAFAGLWVLGWLLKEYTPINNKMIPWILFIAGVILGLCLLEWSLAGGIIGALMAWIIMAVYEHVKNTIELYLKRRFKPGA